MQIIMLTSRRAGSRGVYLGQWTLGALAAGLVALAALAGAHFYSDYNERQAAWAAGPIRQLAATVDDQHVALRRQLAEYRAEIQAHRQRTHGHLDAIALNLGTLQVQTLRLEALGSRLADMAGLDSDEFTLDAPIGLGGPQPPGGELTREADFLEQMLVNLNALERQLQHREAAMHAMEKLLMEHEVQHRSTPRGAPVKNGWVSSAYGYRADPFTGRREFHQGVDISGKYRSQVHAVAAGVVVFSGYRGGYGKMVEIDHGEGYQTGYSHNRKNLVEVGQWVQKGDPIAIMGSTGRSTGAHVHFEVRENGRLVNPGDYISLK